MTCLSRSCHRDGSFRSNPSLDHPLYPRTDTNTRHHNRLHHHRLSTSREGGYRSKRTMSIVPTIRTLCTHICCAQQTRTLPLEFAEQAHRRWMSSFQSPSGQFHHHNRTDTNAVVPTQSLFRSLLLSPPTRRMSSFQFNRFLSLPVGQSTNDSIICRPPYPDTHGPRPGIAPTIPSCCSLPEGCLRSSQHALSCSFCDQNREPTVQLQNRPPPPQTQAKNPPQHTRHKDVFVPFEQHAIKVIRTDTDDSSHAEFVHPRPTSHPKINFQKDVIVPISI